MARPPIISFRVRGILEKSLLISTVEAYFESRRALFEGLATDKFEQD